MWTQNHFGIVIIVNKSSVLQSMSNNYCKTMQGQPQHPNPSQKNLQVARWVKVVHHNGVAGHSPLDFDSYSSLLLAGGTQIDRHNSISTGFPTFKTIYKHQSGYPKTLKTMYGSKAPTEAKAIDLFLITQELFILSTTGDMHVFSVDGGMLSFIPPFSYSFSTRYQYGDTSSALGHGKPPAGIRTMMCYGAFSVDGIIAIVGNDLYQHVSGSGAIWNKLGSLSWLY